MQALFSDEAQGLVQSKGGSVVMLRLEHDLSTDQAGQEEERGNENAHIGQLYHSTRPRETRRTSSTCSRFIALIERFTSALAVGLNELRCTFVLKINAHQFRVCATGGRQRAWQYTLYSPDRDARSACTRSPLPEAHARLRLLGMPDMYC